MRNFNLLSKKGLLFVFLFFFGAGQNVVAATTPGDKSDANFSHEQEDKKKKSLKNELNEQKKKNEKALKKRLIDLDFYIDVVDKNMAIAKKEDVLISKKLALAKLYHQYWKKQLEIQHINTKASDAEDLARHKYFAVLWEHKKKSLAFLFVLPASFGGLLGYLIFF